VVVSAFTPRHPIPAQAAEWAALVRQRMAEGQVFEAYDLCRLGQEAFPADADLPLLSALCLLRCGAGTEALRFLEERDWRPENGGDRRLAAEVCADLWLRAGCDRYLEPALAIELELFGETGDPRHGVQAAQTALRLGRHAEAARLATAIADGPIADWASHMLACVLLGRSAEAEHSARALAEGVGGRYQNRVALRQSLDALGRQGVDVPAALAHWLPLPKVAIFGGQPLDPVSGGRGVFPAELESAVKRNVEQTIERIGIEIGYGCAAAGADLLFVEALLERGAEVNICLPYAREDFVALRVAPAGESWERRFQDALARANSVTQVTEDRHLGHDTLLSYGNRVIDGLARLKARTLGADTHLVTVFDYDAPAGPGSAVEFIDNWADPARLHFIELDDIRAAAALPPAAKSEPAPEPIRPILEPVRHAKAMMFSDVVGFSKLQDAHLPGLWDFFAHVAEAMPDTLPEPEIIESWGDGLFVVMDTAMDLAAYVFALAEAIATADPGRFGLPVPISLRVGVHAGPIFAGRHPLTGRSMVFGGHVNRAARIEPITVPGHIYASQQFVAQLVAEESALEAEARIKGAQYRYLYACDYLGTLELAKNFGRQAVYQLRKVVSP